MRERPILFSAPMVRATLEGRKTQTRRVIKPQPEMVEDRRTTAWEGDPATLLRLLKANNRGCPYGKPGDRLWVRETCKLKSYGKPISEGWGGTIVEYKDENKKEVLNKYATGTNDKWRPSIHMPRWASRITLEVTGIRVERLRDITLQDVLAEGCMLSTSKDEPLDYQNLWESINGPELWASNPWVWVVEFRIGTTNDR